MARARAVIEGDWLLFHTPEGREVMLPTDEIIAVWAGLEKGTLAIERISREEPLVVRYPSVRAFAADFTIHYDERRRAPRKKPVALKVTSLAGTSASPYSQTKKR